MKIAYFYRVDKWGTGDRFVVEAKALGVELVPIKYKELSVKQENGNWQIFWQGKDLSEFDIFYFRAVGSELEWSKLLALYAKKESIPVADEYLATHGALRRFKAVAGVMMEEAGVNYPKTQFVENIDELKRELVNWELPVVIKVSQGGRHGMGTFWIRDKDDMKELEEKAVDKDGKQIRGYLIQPYIPNDGDFRLFVVGYKTLGGFKRMPKEEKVVMNKSVGKSVGLTEVPKDVAKEAEKACKALGVEVAGVDLVKDVNTGKVYIVEVNEAPQYVVFEKRTGKNAVKRVVEYLIKKING
jgi:glutathione synthase/RimK-type ligase-like ATP-grasp enzyme